LDAPAILAAQNGRRLTTNENSSKLAINSKLLGSDLVVLKDGRMSKTV
jgi:hypothetical protein